MKYHTSISGAKNAIEGFARSLASELAPKVRVNTIAPSLVDTPLSNKITSKKETIHGINKKHPLQRIGKGMDIAKTVKFLLSEDSSWITAQTIHLDGGHSTITN